MTSHSASRRAAGALALALACGPLAAERLADHVVLVSVDGLRPEFYRDESWPAPMMQQMRRQGVHAERVRGVFPSVTYPSHTTILTGALPARHGVFYNSPFEPGGVTGRWYWESAGIRVPTLWDAVRQAGLTAANVGWPVSVGAPVDWNLPEVWSIEPGVGTIERMRELSRPAGLWEELEREASGRLTSRNFLIDHLTRDDRAGDLAAYLLETYRPAFTTVHLIEADEFQHETGRSGDLVRRAVAAADRAISQMVEAAERAGILERTAFLVAGDHGHVERQIEIRPNVWLVEAGLMAAVPDRGAWRATFHTSGAAAFLHLADPGDQAAAAAARAVVEARPRGERKLFQLLDRAALDRLAAAPEAAFALVANPGADFQAAPEGPALRPASGATHGHLFEFPEIYTGFVGWGAGLRAGRGVHEIGLEDLAPLVARLLDLELEAPDGVVPLGLLADDPAF
ncbi:MAG: ectonucleotide pyrophosphatase/phosphodiesterase [Acidobacteriota bacterium]|nr:ectonucleotide pyrophosphatase/phosphodiesterase [Acidobacteriota bacterium]